MKIAYILYPGVIISNRSNGVRSQAETWARTLEESGATVDLINNWGNYDWTSYDAIHIFGGGDWVYGISRSLFTFNHNIHWSPIIDPAIDFDYKEVRRVQTLRRLSHGILYGSDKIEKALPYINKVCVRSEFEKIHLQRVYNLKDDKFELVPLSYSDSCVEYTPNSKESFCLHISSIYQERKNVLRLVKAAKKYDFKLVLAGNKGTDKQFKFLKEEIGTAKNIEVLGFISEEQKIDLYKRAKVFCLPSLKEGVGIVALDAAYYGCEIVITNYGGPKEYYEGKCYEVNPLDVDDIGTKVMKALDESYGYQPTLQENIRLKYSTETLKKLLLNIYQ